MSAKMSGTSDIVFKAGRAPKQSRLWKQGTVYLVQQPDGLLAANGVSGYMTYGDLSTIRDVARRLPQDAVYVEIGSWEGLSALVAAATFMRRGNVGARVYCVDAWDAVRFAEPHMGTVYRRFLRNVRDSGLERMIIPRRGLSHVVSRQFRRKSVDAVFVDGDHSYQSCWRDLVKWAPKLTTEGILFGHDATAGSEVLRAVHDFSTARSLVYRIHRPPAAWYMWEIEGAGR